jgi:antitoxin component YwqK of YwqJK toxin-antitoxin module
MIECPEGTTWKASEVRVKDFRDMKNAIEQYCVKQNNNHGPYVIHYKDNGQLAAKGSFVEGKLDGWMKYWRESGKKRVDKLFDNGTKKEEIKYDLKGNVESHVKW